MGTLGQYLKSAREARGLDIRDAAQQTRISINYLKALEEEDFSKLPGEVFVKGFLKSYGRFLNIPEADVLTRYAELKPQQAPLPVAGAEPEKKTTPSENGTREAPIEPFVWGAVIVLALIIFLFTSLPSRQAKNGRPENGQAHLLSSIPTETSSLEASRPEKLYLEVVATEDTWLLVRTDTSPQKKAVLKAGESLIWSADERFLLSYGGVGALKLLLNGEELEVKGTRGTPVRDLAVTRAGVLNQPVPVKQTQPVRPKQKPSIQADGQIVPVQPSPVPVSAQTPPVQASPAPVPDQTPVATAPAPADAPINSVTPVQ